MLALVIILGIYEVKPDLRIKFNCNEPVLESLVIEIEAFKCFID